LFLFFALYQDDSLKPQLGPLEPSTEKKARAIFEKQQQAALRPDQLEGNTNIDDHKWKYRIATPVVL
jgi:hypothetical protein